MNARLLAGVAVVASGVAVGLAFALTGLSESARVQRADKGGVLAVLFTDARAFLANELLVKADEYFHGGLNRRTAGNCHEDHACGDGCEHDHAPDAAGPSTFDPWAWIADGIAAPTVHRHLEAQEAAEMLPLVWAAAKADPGNDEAWGTAWYVVNFSLCRKDLARRLLEEGMSLRPDSVELPFLYGETEWSAGKGDAVAAERWFRRACDVAFEKGKGSLTGLANPKEVHTARLALTFLAAIARDRRDRPALMALLKRAEESGRDNVAYQSVTNALAHLESLSDAPRTE